MTILLSALLLNAGVAIALLWAALNDAKHDIERSSDDIDALNRRLNAIRKDIGKDRFDRITTRNEP